MISGDSQEFREALEKALEKFLIEDVRYEISFRAKKKSYDVCWVGQISVTSLVDVKQQD